MGVMVTDRRCGLRVLAAVLFGVMLIVLLLLPARASGSVPPLVTASDNASGRYDTVVLRDLGKRTAAVVAMVAEDDTLTPQQLWRSKAGKLDVRNVKWLAADVNADGLADGVALLDLGKGRSRFVIYQSNGDTAVPKTAWTSKKGAFAWARVKLAVGDLDGDGCDDVVGLYDRGKAGVALYRFISTGTAFTMSAGWTIPAGEFAWAESQLAAGDFTGDGQDDALVLSQTTAAMSRLLVFTSSAAGFTKAEFWSGAYAARTAQLGAGDVDSDGDFDAVCLQSKGDGAGRLDVFISSGSTFADPTPWYDGAALPGSGGRLVVGDVSGDGRADALIARPSGGSSSSLLVCVSSGAAFRAQTWWSGAWPYARLRLGCAPSPGLVVSDKAEVADAATLAALSGLAPDGTLVFDRETAQLRQLEPGDVLISQPDAEHPEGIFRKVSAVSESGGGVAVATTPAALDDVVQNGEVAFVKHVTPGDLSQAGVTQPGVRLTSGRGDALVSFDIETTIDDIVEVDGSISLDPIAYFSYQTSWGVLTGLSYTQVMNATADIDVEVVATLSQEIEQTIFEAPLGTMAVVVPPGVPIWVTPVFKVYVGASGQVSAGVTAGVTETCSATVNLGYWDWSFHTPTSTFTKQTEWRRPQLFGALELKAYTGAGIEFLLYSIAGPEANIEVALTLDANTSKTPWWELYAGVDFVIGVTLDLRVTDIGASYPLNLFKYRIDWARTPWGTRGVSGKVTSAATGSPVSAATVELHQGAGSPSGAVWGTTTTTANGTYSFSGPPVGEYTLVARKSGYQPGQRGTTVVNDLITENQDIALAAELPQGVSGLITSSVTGNGIAGASVELHVGGSNPNGDLWGTTTSGNLGQYEFRGMPAGGYTVVASKSGYATNSRSVAINTGIINTGRDVILTPVVIPSMRSALDGYIRWTAGVANPNATYEFWYRPTDFGGMEYGLVLAQISRDYPNWMGDGPHRWPIMAMHFSGSLTAPTVTFQINENADDESGTWHRVTSTTQLQLGHWYHFAVQNGSQGMKLFVNGHLEAHDAYTGRPEANNGASPGGWFSLGDNRTLGSGYMTAAGDYRGLRVSSAQRYSADFSPVDVPSSDASTDILDALAGTTNGENVNFVPTP